MLVMFASLPFRMDTRFLATLIQLKDINDITLSNDKYEIVSVFLDSIINLILIK